MPVLAQRRAATPGTCHGSAKGKNGFKLSLRGYDADYDYNALVNDLHGRRVNRVRAGQEPDAAQADRRGAARGRAGAARSGARQYEMIHEWIKEGVQRRAGCPRTARPKKLEVLPQHVDLDLPGRTQRVVVLAHYPDGRRAT